MPTEEERRREYRPGYNPRGNYTSPWPSKWDAAKAELNSLRGGPAAFGSAETVERGVNAVKGFMGSVPERLYEEGEQYLNKVRDKTMGPAARAKRLEMANYPSEANRLPNMPQAAPEMPVMQDRESEAQRLPAYRQPEPAAVANGSDTPGPRPGMSSKSSSSASVGVVGSGRGGTGPTISANDQEYLNRQPVTADPRKRYFDMAQMSLEQREQYLNSLPEGQRPIQTLRGNKEGWYSPGMSKEFATIPEAMSGVEGRPTLKSEMGREEEARDRAAMVDMAGARNRTALAGEGMRQAGQDRRLLKEHELGVLKGSKGANGKPSEEWKFEKNPTNEGGEAGVIVEKNSGMVLPVRMDKSKDIAAVFRNLPKTEWGGAASFLGRFDRETRNETFKYLPPEMKEEMIKYFESESAKGKQKKE